MFTWKHDLFIVFLFHSVIYTNTTHPSLRLECKNSVAFFFSSVANMHTDTLLGTWNGSPVTFLESLLFQEPKLQNGRKAPLAKVNGKVTNLHGDQSVFPKDRSQALLTFTARGLKELKVAVWSDVTWFIHYGDYMSKQSMQWPPSTQTVTLGPLGRACCAVGRPHWLGTGEESSALSQWKPRVLHQSEASVCMPLERVADMLPCHNPQTCCDGEKALGQMGAKF